VSQIVTKPPSEPAQRGLTLIAKTLQNVANNVTFGNKEEYMVWLNDFITANFSACQDYFDQMATVPSSGPTISTGKVDPADKEKALDYVHTQAKKLEGKMTKYSKKPFYPSYQKNLRAFEQADASYEEEKFKLEQQEGGQKKKRKDCFEFRTFTDT